MKITCILPDNNEFDICNQLENYILPVPATIRITGCESIYINSILQKIPPEGYSFGYFNEDLTFIYDNEKYNLKSYGIEPPMKTKSEYSHFAKCLKANGIDGKIDYESLFLSIENSDMPDIGIKLCTFDREIKNVSSDSILEIIHRDRAHLLWVFMHPKVHLKDINEILPIEIVTRISHKTITHLASHSEHWESRKASGLIPSRLLARTLEDDFAIYENIAAKNLVDKLYKRILKKRKEIKDIRLSLSTRASYTTLSCETENVFRAQNVLFNGYSEGSTKHISDITDKQEKMVEDILEVLICCRESSQYNRLKKVPSIGSPLKATNIFMMDKHYKYVYKLWKLLSAFQYIEDNQEEKVEVGNSYNLFCQTLVHFALANFNFKSKDLGCNIFDNDKMFDTLYSFENWNCKVSQIDINMISSQGIVLEFGEKVEYKFSIEKYDMPISCCSTGWSCYEGNLILEFIPSDAQMNDICFKLYPNLKKRDHIASEKRTSLKQKLYENLHGQKTNNIKAVLIPLNYIFSDSEKDVRNCIDRLQNDLKTFFNENNIQYCYFLTPFRPNDYENSESFSKDHAKLLLNYPSINNPRKEINFGTIPICITDINSFRRITKILLMHMIEIDEQHKVCPLCGDKLIKSNDDTYVCYSCSPQFKLRKTKCAYCGKYYWNSDYKKPEFFINDEPSYALIMNEIRNGFKNITDIDIETEISKCPYCKDKG